MRRAPSGTRLILHALKELEPPVLTTAAQGSIFMRIPTHRECTPSVRMMSPMERNTCRNEPQSRTTTHRSGSVCGSPGLSLGVARAVSRKREQRPSKSEGPQRVRPAGNRISQAQHGNTTLHLALVTAAFLGHQGKPKNQRRQELWQTRD